MFLIRPISLQVFLSLICFQLAACDFASEFFNRPPFVPSPSGGFAINIRENANGGFSPDFFDFKPAVAPISQAFSIDIKEDSHGAQLPIVPIHQRFDVPAIPILAESPFPVDILSQGIPFEDFNRREFELARPHVPTVIPDPSLLLADFLREKPVVLNSGAYSIDIQEPIENVNVALKSLEPSHAYVISTRSESSPRLKAD